MNFVELKSLVEDWGKDKGITEFENVDKQFMKFVEEVIEFKTELDIYCLFDVDKEIYLDLKIELGDILVTLIIMSKQLEVDPVECLEMAYNKIKNRNGKTINGTYVKSEDLE